MRSMSVGFARLATSSAVLPSASFAAVRSSSRITATDRRASWPRGAIGVARELADLVVGRLRAAAGLRRRGDDRRRRLAAASCRRWAARSRARRRRRLRRRLRADVSWSTGGCADTVVGIPALFGLFLRVGVEPRRHVDAHVAGADDRLEQRHDLRGQVALDALLAFERHAAVARPRSSPSVRESGRPKVSMMTTASGRSDSTLAGDEAGDAGDRRRPRAAGCCAASGRPTPWPAAASPVKSESLASAMCTRALATSPIVEIVRASSPSRPRR